MFLFRQKEPYAYAVFGWSALTLKSYDIRKKRRVFIIKKKGFIVSLTLAHSPYFMDFANSLSGLKLPGASLQTLPMSEVLSQSSKT